MLCPGGSVSRARAAKGPHEAQSHEGWAATGPGGLGFRESSSPRQEHLGTFILFEKKIDYAPLLRILPIPSLAVPAFDPADPLSREPMTMPSKTGRKTTSTALFPETP